ncbi:MAG: hypothetical protein MI751_07660 [Pseudomonadales bacterium]|nr:hypothetical protein [Pseudomonadales bacterium]
MSDNIDKFSESTQELIEYGRKMPGVKEVKAYTRQEFLNLSKEELEAAPVAVRRMYMRMKNTGTTI